MEKDEVERLIEEHPSIRSISRATGLSYTATRYWIKRYGLKTKGLSSRMKRKPKSPCKNCGNPVKENPNVYCSQTCMFQFWRRRQIENEPDKAGIRLRKNYLIDCRGYACEVCGIREWMGQAAPIELDHKDGHPLNNELNNLQLICPNCHAQTKTYKGRNKGNGRYIRKPRYAAGKSF